MINSKAFRKEIDPIGSENELGNLVHQVSPAWVLTFVRWSARDTLRTKTIDPLSVEKPLVVENDCVAVSTADAKSTLTPTVSITLVESDTNYATSIAPGDFVFVNMLNWEVDARKVADAARSGNQINGIDDGFKGIFKIQSVRKTISVDQNSGMLHVRYKVDGYAFTEFNNTIYFNPFMLDQSDTDNQLLFASYIGRDWTRIVNAKGLTNVQDIIATLIESFIGSGINAKGLTDKNGTVRSPNVHFRVPQMVGQLLGLRGVKAAKDIFTYIFGIQKYNAGQNTTLATGLNPSSLFPCRGNTLVKPEFWNQVKTWSILNQFTNAPLNELYTAFKVSADGSVMPTVVFRQIPFTTEGFGGSTRVTKFLSLPRWVISPALITDADIGREEAARVNFVQVFGRTSITKDGSDQSIEIGAGNYVSDIGDVTRSGLRPYIVNTQFDDPTINKTSEFNSPMWARIIADSLIGGHLKLNGTIQCAGIVDPIAVGDNLEFDGVVYHIEQVSHQCLQAPGGRKSFRTTIGLSSGVAATDSSDVRYGEMDYPGAEGDRDRDSKNLKILPGVSEAQDVGSRKGNVDVANVGITSFAQPGAQTKKARDE